MFEDLKKLYDIFVLYREGKPFKPIYAALTLEGWAVKKANNLES